jgi:spermidine synthase
LKPARFAVLAACFALSGCAALIYQTVFSQELTLALGATQPAIAAVLAATMAGLALGALVAGRYEAGLSRPLRVYAWLELGIGLSAWLVPYGVGLAGRLQAALFAGRTEEAWPAWLFNLGAALSIVTVPSALMGATLPLLARRVVRTSEELGRRISWLYAVNTFGAAAGALAGAWLLLPRLGLDGALHTAVGQSVAVALLAFALDHGSEAEPRFLPVSAWRTAGGETWVLPAIAFSGAISFVYEVTWTRLLGHLLGGSLYAFGLMLATQLLGLAAGAALAAWFTGERNRARRAFAGAQLIAGGATLASFTLLDRLPEWLERAVPATSEAFPAGSFAGAILMLPGALAIGATFPLAVRILAEGPEAAGWASARVFGWNTVGAIAGALAAAFLLLPSLGFAGTMTAAVVANLGVAIFSASRGRPARRPAFFAALLVLTWLALAPLQTPWQVLRHSPLGGRLEGETVFSAVGRSSTVLTLDTGTDFRISTDGMPEAAVLPPGGRPGRQPTTSWLALLPLAARPEARSMLVIGLGGGATLEEIPAGVEKITAVEIEKQVVAANLWLSPYRRKDPLEDPRVKVVVDDARGFLRLTEARYDVIVSQPSHPFTAGASHLFTREMFELARGRLAPGGVLVQWIGLTMVDPEALRSMVATLRSVFPEVEVYCPPPGGAALFLASERPLGLDAAAAEAAAEGLPIWRRLGVRSGDDLLIAKVIGADARAFGADAPLNTDRRNLLETRSLFLVRRPAAPSLAAIAEAWRPFDPLPRTQSIDLPAAVLRLLDQRDPERAAAVAKAIEDPRERRKALAVVDLVGGLRQRGEATLAKLIAEDPTDSWPRRVLVRYWHEPLLKGANSPPWLTDDAPAAAVALGWRRQHQGDPSAIEDLEGELAELGSRDPLFAPATRLRIAWRQAKGDPQRAQEALDLLEPLLAERNAAPDLLQRAQLGLAAGDLDAALVSLAEIAELPRRGQLESIRSAALALAGDQRLASRPEAQSRIQRALL